ncbi:MAG: hypothetical protein KAH00_05530 [Cocleimonas sp.]|nr:hypothetical protein [Cocleimonas sp.]
MPTKNYNIAIISRDNTIYAWQKNVLTRLLALENITISLHLSNPSSIVKPSLALRFIHHVERFLYNCQPDFFIEVPVDTLLKNVEKKKMADTEKADLSELDFAINLSEQPLPDALLKQPKLGVWSIFMGDNEKVSSQLTAINDFISENDVVTIGLQLETLKDEANITLHKSQAAIDMASLCRTAEQCLHKSAQFIPQYLAQMQHGKGVTLLEFAQTKAIKNSISLTESASLIWQSVKRVGKKMDHKYRAKEQWALIYADSASKASSQTEHNANLNFASFKTLTPPQDRFWADPFVVSRDNKNYIFFEELLFERDLGHLCCMELYADGRHSEPVKILEKPYHLSYPFVFQYKNEDYMIPESGEQECVQLYKCTEFPYQWTFEKNLLENTQAYDSTVFGYNGRWWLFACIAVDRKSSSTEDLHLFYADSPISDHWQAHPMNPIVSDAATARPAGNIFEHNNKIYRPSQNCARSYGAGLNLCEITQLTTTNYSEKVVSKIFPDWDKRLKGLHTFNANDNITVSDVIIDQR